MRPTSPRRRISLVAATAAAMLLFTGCASSQAGAAAFIGDQRISNDQIEAEIAEREELGQATPQDRRIRTANEVLSEHIMMTALTQLADDEGITVTSADVNALVAQVGGRERLTGQGLSDFQINDQAMKIIIGEALIEGADQGVLLGLEDRVREEMRRDFTAEGQSLGIAEDELEQRVEEALTGQEPSIKGEASNRYLNERILPYLVGLEIRLSPRYGVIDPATLEILPGVSPLSAPAAPSIPSALLEP